MTTLTGTGPVAFTCSKLGQVQVPLSAFDLSGGVVSLVSTWENTFTPADSAVLLALAQIKFAAGEIFTLPVPPQRPAIVLTAATSGSAGNGIAVTASLVAATPPPASPADATAQVSISATRTDVYAALTSVSAAITAIGIDPTNPLTGQPSATGPLAIANDSTLNAGATGI
ncbi:MAG TPA: hypothetical protein VFN61_07200, partial [Acidimicrobiales bacterium]|nr:hypothetical protein [Acidimicrobiales bacterium]